MKTTNDTPTFLDAVAQPANNPIGKASVEIHQFTPPSGTVNLTGHIALKIPKAVRLADEFFNARYAFDVIEDKMETALIEACGLTSDGDWPFENITFDGYDMSFEFKRIKGDWTPTVEQLATCWAMGFSRCWLCYDDGTERFCYSAGGIGERHAKGAPVQGSK